MNTKLPKSFDKDWYLKLNPDVEQAVEKGTVSSGTEHFMKFGFSERRKFKKPLFYIPQYFHLKINKNKVNDKGKNNALDLSAGSLKNVEITFNGSNNHVLIKGGAKLRNCRIVFNGDNHYLEIGFFCLLNGTGFFFEDHHCKIILKDNTTTVQSVNFYSLEPYSKIQIGEDCMFASFIELRTSDSHTIYDIHTQKRENYAKDIRIGNHVWVCLQSSFLKGSIIPDNCIVAMRAIVANEFTEPGCIIGGVPARIISRGKNWKRERIYE